VQYGLIESRQAIPHTVYWYLSHNFTLNLVCNLCFAVFLRYHQFINGKNFQFTDKTQENKEGNTRILTDILGLTNEAKRYYTVSYLQNFFVFCRMAIHFFVLVLF